MLVLGVGVCFLIKALGLDNLNTIKSLLNDNIWGSVFYVALLAFQVVFVPINALILIIPAMMTFGAIKTFFLSFIALMIGSCIAYYIGKIFGINVLNFFAGGSQAEKLQKALSKNGKFVLPLFLLIPIFPDELICMLAGIAKLNFGYFVIVSIVTRIIDLSSICFIGAILPMQGWWLVLWIVLICLGTILAIYVSRNQEKLQNKLEQFLLKRMKTNQKR